MTDKAVMTSITIQKSTRKRMSEHMKHEQTYDDYLVFLLNQTDWVERNKAIPTIIQVNSETKTPDPSSSTTQGVS